MTNTEIKRKINTEIHFNIECATVGRKFVHFNTFWSKGANVGERGNFQAKVKLPREVVETYIGKNDWQSLAQEIRFAQVKY